MPNIFPEQHQKLVVGYPPVLSEIRLRNQMVDLLLRVIFPQYFSEVLFRNISRAVAVQPVEGFGQPLFLYVTTRLYGRCQEFGIADLSTFVKIQPAKHFIDVLLRVPVPEFRHCFLELRAGDVSFIVRVVLVKDLLQVPYFGRSGVVRNKHEGHLLDVGQPCKILDGVRHLLHDVVAWVSFRETVVGSDPFVLHRARGGGPEVGVGLEKAPDKCLRMVRNRAPRHIVEIIFTFLDPGYDLASVVTVEGKAAGKQHVRDDAHAPQVCL
mmetsp:Transcript_33167/g.65670  ORF Transcript_33167/g.65670 Transcript_33167/m.65670 type:complete len:267 (+) Transcript_33167:226-1026(+)